MEAGCILPRREKFVLLATQLCGSERYMFRAARMLSPAGGRLSHLSHLAFRDSFWLDRGVLEALTFETADDSIARLVRAKQLPLDSLVSRLQQGDGFRTERLRIAQRRFLQSTGLTREMIQTTERAHTAILISHAMKRRFDLRYVAALFFSDQAHLKRAWKRMIGLTPA